MFDCTGSRLIQGREASETAAWGAHMRIGVEGELSPS